MPKLVVLRFESYWEFPLEQRGDGYTVSQYCDIYQAGWYKEAAEGMHAAGGKIIGYLNFSGMPDFFEGDPTRPNPNFNPDWALRNEAGNYVSSKGFPQLKAMDPMSQGFRDYLIANIQARLDEGYDGVFADVAIAPRFPDDYTYDSRAMNPRTPGVLYEDWDYMQDRVDLANYVKSRVPNALIIANGWWNGDRYFKYHDAYLYIFKNLKIDGAFSEGVFAGMTGTIWGEEGWNKSVQMIEEIQKYWLVERGRLYVSYSQGERGATANNITKEKMAAFLYASSLMGFSKNGNVFCAHNAMISGIQDILKLDLGSPIGTYAQLHNSLVFERVFSNFKVYVNISKDTAYDIEGLGPIQPLGSLFVETATPPTESLLPAIVPAITGALAVIWGLSPGWTR